MRGMRTQWPAVNNLLFCFIANRDATLFFCEGAPIGQGLQTHSSRIRRIKEVKSSCICFIYLRKNMTLLNYPPQALGMTLRMS